MLQKQIDSLNCQLRLINYFDMKEPWNLWTIQFNESKNWNKRMTCHIYHSIWMKFCGRFAIHTETFSSVQILINKRNGTKRNRMSMRFNWRKKLQQKGFTEYLPINTFTVQLHFRFFFSIITDLFKIFTQKIAK